MKKLWRKCILTNYAYIGKKEINKKKKTEDQEKLSKRERYGIVDAVWEPIVDTSWHTLSSPPMENCRRNS
ncbi:MAG: recombinase family protein [Anaerolineae bacterium]